jgi:hypothetical protein
MLFLSASTALLTSTPSMATLTLLDDGTTKLTLFGSLELDSMWDSTRSFTDTTANLAVQRTTSDAYQASRFQLSNRDSRFFLQLDTSSGGWHLEGVVAMDFLGFDPTPGNGGTSVTSTTLGSFYMNPTPRLFLGYLQADQEGWGVLAGSYWTLFGWLPYYNLSPATIFPYPGTLFARTLQVRGMKTVDIGQVKAQGAVTIGRNPQPDAGTPDLQAGLRFTFDGWKGTTPLVGPSSPMLPQPLSIGVSGLFREISVPDTTTSVVGHNIDYAASAVSVNTFIPIIPLSEGSPQNLNFMGGFTTGRGYGDQFIFYTGGTALNLNSAQNGEAGNLVTAGRPVNLDGGIGDFDAAGAFHLIQLTSVQAQLQYVLPFQSTTWVDFGYTRLSSNNVSSLVGTNGFTSASTANAKFLPYTSERSFFLNAFHDLGKSVRVGLEYALFQTVYADTMIANDNRYSAVGYYFF